MSSLKEKCWPSGKVSHQNEKISDKAMEREVINQGELMRSVSIEQNERVDEKERPLMVLNNQNVIRFDGQAMLSSEKQRIMLHAFETLSCAHSVSRE